MMTNRSFGHASTQSPHAVHLAGSTTGSPVVAHRMAPNSHDALAVGQSQAAPGASLATRPPPPRPQHSVEMPRYSACATRHVSPAGALHPRHAPHRRPCLDAEQAGDGLVHRRRCPPCTCSAGWCPRRPARQTRGTRAGRTRRSWRWGASTATISMRGSSQTHSLRLASAMKSAKTSPTPPSDQDRVQRHGIRGSHRGQLPCSPAARAARPRPVRRHRRHPRPARPAPPLTGMANGVRARSPSSVRSSAICQALIPPMPRLRRLAQGRAPSGAAMARGRRADRAGRPRHPRA